MDIQNHLSGTIFVKPVMKQRKENISQAFWLSPISFFVIYEVSAKHLQDMPVKVADRYDTGCVDANLTGSLLIYKKNYNIRNN